MAHPADNAPKAPASFASTRLTPEEADRLASTFRPSWELDDAPFTGPGTLSTADVQMLQGGGTHADVRASAQVSASNDAHAVAAHTPPAPVTTHEPENSVIIDRSITADQIAPPRLVLAPATFAEAAPAAPAPATGPTGTVVIPPDRAPKIAPRAPAASPTADRTPAARRQAASAMSDASAGAVPVGLDEPVFPQKSKKGLFLGLGAVAAVLVVGGIYMTTSGSSPEKAAPAVATAMATETNANDKASAIPPPPPETTTAAPAAPPPPETTTAAPVAPPPPETRTAAPAAPPPPETAAARKPTPPPAPAPAPPPPPTHVAAASPPRTSSAPPAAAPAAPKPKKSGQTIVHDVPF